MATTGVDSQQHRAPASPYVGCRAGAGAAALLVACLLLAFLSPRGSLGPTPSLLVGGAAAAETVPTRRVDAARTSTRSASRTAAALVATPTQLTATASVVRAQSLVPGAAPAAATPSATSRGGLRLNESQTRPGSISPTMNASARSSVATPAPSGTPAALGRYLILRTIAYGQYSNQKLSFLDGLGLAAFVGRTLVAPRLKSCSGNVSAPLYDVDAATAGAGALRYHPATTDLRRMCGPTGILVALRPVEKVLAVPRADWRRSSRTTLVHAGITWTVMNLAEAVPDAGVPADLAAFARKEDVDLDVVEPYASYYPRPVASECARLLTDPALPWRLRTLSDVPCVMFDHLFCDVQWAVMGSGGAAFVSTVKAVQTVAPIEAAVDAWFRKRGIPQHVAVGVHLRGGDMRNRAGFPRDCNGDPRVGVDALRALVAAAGPAAAERPLLIATDDATSPCAAAVLAAFPRHVLVEPPESSIAGIGGLGGPCVSNAFMQEVLARTSAFMGTGASTWSTSVHWLRVARYGHAPSTSIFPAGADEAARKPARRSPRPRSDAANWHPRLLPSRKVSRKARRRPSP